MVIILILDLLVLFLKMHQFIVIIILFVKHFE